MALPSRVDVSPAAAELLVKLSAINGPLMFHQSGGLLIPELSEPIQVWMSAAQFEYWKHTHLTIDVVDGRGGGFSLESTEGKRFLIRSRLFSDEEWLLLENESVKTGAS